MTIKRPLDEWTIDAIGLANATVNINAFGHIKELKAPRRPKIPKTPADYEAMHAAEMKRRRKATLRAQQYTSAT